MDPYEHQFMDDLVRRYAAGERSPELLAMLDGLTKACLDGLESARPMTQGRLPIDDDPPPQERVQAAKVQLALLALASRLEAMGLWSTRGQAGLHVDLPYDPVADVLTRLHFRVDSDMAGFHLGVTADRTWPASQGQSLRAASAAWDAQPRRLRSLPWQPREASRIRLRLVGWVSLREAGDLPSLMAEVLDEVEAFHRLLA